MIEEDIMQFLQDLLSILNTKVANSWTKFESYLQFWCNFVESGTAQLDFAFRHNFVALFIDFILEKASPLSCYGEKKHQMGNRFAKAVFDPVIQMISTMVQQARSLNGCFLRSFRIGKIFDLSENDMSCLNS